MLVETTPGARVALPQGFDLYVDGSLLIDGGGYPDGSTIDGPEALGPHTVDLYNSFGFVVARATFTVIASNPVWPIPGGLTVSPNPAAPGAPLHIATSAAARAALEGTFWLLLDGGWVADGGGIPDPVVTLNAPDTGATHTLSIFFLPNDGPVDWTRPVAVATLTVLVPPTSTPTSTPPGTPTDTATPTSTPDIVWPPTFTPVATATATVSPTMIAGGLTLSPETASYGQPVTITTSSAVRAFLSGGYRLDLDGQELSNGGGYPDWFGVGAPEALGQHVVTVLTMNYAPLASATFTVVATSPPWPLPGGVSVSPNPASPYQALHFQVSAAALAALQGSCIIAIDGKAVGFDSGDLSRAVVYAPAVDGLYTLALYYRTQSFTVDWSRPVAVTTLAVGQALPTDTATATATPSATATTTPSATATTTPTATATTTATATATATASSTPSATRIPQPVLAATGLSLSLPAGVPLTGTQVASFTDSEPGTSASYYTALLTWGDGTAQSAGLISSAQGHFIVRGTHLYRAAGTFIVGVAIRASDGRGTTTQSVATVRGR